ncbi:MAG: c-type cytochrome domain-containing protein [Bacteroidia bacterium]
MKWCHYLILIILVSCTRKKGLQVKPNAPGSVSPTPVLCSFQSNVIISYSNTINPILQANCLPCHATPGSGGINLDSYSTVAATAQSGQLYQAIIHDTTYVIMPPPPQKQLDSCQVKAIWLWTKQGRLNN